MGLAASQARLLFITARQNDVSARMQKISSANMVLARDEDDVMTEYNRRLNAKIRQPVDELALGYEYLMGAGAYKTNTINLVTDAKTGQVVLNSRILQALDLPTDSGNGDTFKNKYPDVASFKAALEPTMETAAAELTATKKTAASEAGDWSEAATEFIAKYGEYPTQTRQINLQSLADAEHMGGDFNSKIRAQSTVEYKNNKAGATATIEPYATDTIKAIAKALNINETGMLATMKPFVTELKLNAENQNWPSGDSHFGANNARNSARGCA